MKNALTVTLLLCIGAMALSGCVAAPGTSSTTVPPSPAPLNTGPIAEDSDSFATATGYTCIVGTENGTTTGVVDNNGVIHNE